MIMSYQFRWYPTEDQKAYLAQASGCAKVVYNLGVAANLEASKIYYECIKSGNPIPKEAKAISANELDRRVVQLKRTERYRYLADAPAMALNYAIRNFGEAQDNYFNSLSGERKGEKVGKPKFKKFPKDGIQKISFAAGGSGPVAEGELTRSGKPKKFNPGNCYLKNGKLKIPGIDRNALNIHWHRPIPVDSRLLEVHLLKNLVDQYFVTLVMEVPNLERKPTGKSVGLDQGIKDYLITSEEEKINLPAKLNGLHKKVKKLSSKFSKAKDGSKRQKKLKQSRRKVLNKIRNIQLNTLHEITSKLVKEHDIICIEDLDVKSMLKNKRYAPAIHKLAWGEFRRQLKYKAENSGVKLIEIDRYYASSQICNKCKMKNTQMKDPRNRVLKCTCCGHTEDRDINAAKNILEEGLRLV